MTSSSTEISQQIDTKQIFDRCVTNLNAICAYYKTNTGNSIFSSQKPLSVWKRFGARYLLVEFVRILLYSLMKNRDFLSQEGKASRERAIEVLDDTTTILTQGFQIVFLKNEIILDAVQWIRNCLTATEESCFNQDLFPSQADFLLTMKLGNSESTLSLSPCSSNKSLTEGRLGGFFENYKKLYKDCIQIILPQTRLSEALDWFSKSSKEEDDDFLPHIKQLAAKLYVRASSAGSKTTVLLDITSPNEFTMMTYDAMDILDPRALTESKALIGMGTSMSILFGIFFPPTGISAIDAAVKSGEAHRRTETAIEHLNEHTAEGLLPRVFERSRKHNRKAMIFALLVAIMWSFSERKNQILMEDKFYGLPEGAKFFRDILAPVAREIIAVGESYLQGGSAFLRDDDIVFDLDCGKEDFDNQSPSQYQKN